MDNVVYLNVGGVHFPTRRSTINVPNTFFEGILRQFNEPCVEIFLDRDPTHFRHILNWLRGSRHLPDNHCVLEELLHEADFFLLQDMKEAIIRRRSTSPCIERSLAMICEELRQGK